MTWYWGVIIGAAAVVGIVIGVYLLKNRRPQELSASVDELLTKHLDATEDRARAKAKAEHKKAVARLEKAVSDAEKKATNAGYSDLSDYLNSNRG